MKSSPLSTFSKAKRRRKQPINNEIQQHDRNSNNVLWLTKNEPGDEQSDLPQNESNISQVLPWWEDNHQEKCGNEDDSNDDMLTTSDEKLQKIVDGALDIMLASSKTTIRNQIKTFADRKVLTGNLSSRSNNACTHSKRYARLPRKTYSSDHSLLLNECITPIDPTNIGHQLLKKIGWTPGDGLGPNQNGIKTPIQTIFRHHRQGLGYEKTSINTNESFSYPLSQIEL